ncbi:MAG: peptidyl-alpha-hydroxyglycine alpha-amidating lyase family protein [Dehalococcoidia bacterium]
MEDIVLTGSGNFSYKFIKSWEKMPTGYSWNETVGAIADKNDNIYVFNRGPHPVMVFDNDGNFISSWGEDIFSRPHGISLGPDNTIYCTDDGDHTVRQCTLDGKILLTIGTPNKPSAPFSGTPFNRCTHTATDPNSGNIFITDGYKNSRIHKYSPDGNLITSWGTSGTDEGEFNIVHNIAIDKDGYLYVCDRENHRIQIFDQDGVFETFWSNLHRPCAIFIDNDDLIYVGELGFGTPISRDVPNIGPRVSILNKKGQILSRLGDMGYGTQLGQFIAPHGICLDSGKNIFISEVARTNMKLNNDPEEEVRSFQKLQKIT